MMILLGPKNSDAERVLMHSILDAEPDEESPEQSFWEPDRPVLCTKEFADEYSLMHYRTRGSRNGVRRYQDRNGKLTPEGYRHYAEMYGWGKFRADRAQSKADKYAEKAEKAKVDLDRQQVRADRARVKMDRRGTDRAAEKSTREDHRLNEARLRYDEYTMKANKYQDKSDRIHDKWDEKTRNMEEQAQNWRTNESESRYWRQRTEAEGKAFGEANASYRQDERRAAAKAEKLEAELARRGIQPKGSRIDESTPERQELARKAEESVRSTLDKLHKSGDMTDAMYERELRERGLAKSDGDKKRDKEAEYNEKYGNLSKRVARIYALDSGTDKKEADELMKEIEKLTEEEQRWLYDDAIARGQKMRMDRNYESLGDLSKEAEKRLNERGIKDADYETVADEMDKIQKEIDDRIENNRFAEGSKAFYDDAKFWENKVEKFGSLDEKERRGVEKRLQKQMAEDLELASKRDPDDMDAEHQRDAIEDYRQSLKVMQKNFDQLSPQARDYAAKAMAQIIDNKYLDSESPIPREIRDALNQGGWPDKPNKIDASNVHDLIDWWVTERMDKKSGNMNVDEWQPGSRGEKARQVLKKGWDESEARALEVSRSIGVTDEDAWWNFAKKDFKKVQKALESDQIYQALKERDNLNGKALVKAVAKDMGFPTTPEVLNALEWYVWRD